MAAKLLPMPGVEEKDLINRLISEAAQVPSDGRRSAKRELNASIAFILAAYGVRHLKCDGYTVKVVDRQDTPKGNYPVVRIVPEKHSGTGYCPHCGWPSGVWLDGHPRAVTWCPGCAKVYYRDLAEEWGF